jgi:hypothetical protein
MDYRVGFSAVDQHVPAGKCTYNGGVLQTSDMQQPCNFHLSLTVDVLFRLFGTWSTLLSAVERSLSVVRCDCSRG